jgi:hypothetical protein
MFATRCVHAASEFYLKIHFISAVAIWHLRGALHVSDAVDSHCTEPSFMVSLVAKESPPSEVEHQRRKANEQAG